jgi:hypothetical protein
MGMELRIDMKTVRAWSGYDFYGRSIEVAERMNIMDGEKLGRSGKSTLLVFQTSQPMSLMTKLFIFTRLSFFGDSI